MKWPLLLSLLALISSMGVPCQAAEDGGKKQEGLRHVEKDGGFSFVVPEGWEAREIPGFKYKFIMGPVKAGFTSNINVVDEAYEGTLENYLKATKETLAKVFKKYKLIQSSEFKFESGLTGARLIVENEQGGILLRQAFYIAPSSKTMYVITCSTLAEGGEKFDGIFESSLKTFRLEKK